MLLSFLCFLVPIAIYCSVLAVLNRRLHPIMIPGSWDFGALLFACSGFFLIIVPSLLNNLFLGVVNQLPFQEHGSSPESVESVVTLWWVTWWAYHALVGVAALALVWTRRGKTVLYNINPTGFRWVLDRVLERLPLEARRRDDCVYLGYGATNASSEAALPESSADEGTSCCSEQSGEALPDEATFRVESFPTLWNVTLHWPNPRDPLRHAVETGLAVSFREIATDDNPAGNWLLGVAGFLFSLIFMAAVGLTLMPMLAQGH